MSPSSDSRPEAEMRDEYAFSRGVRGKHLEQYRRGANVVVLDPDIAAVFADPESVNRALRLLMRVVVALDQP